MNRRHLVALSLCVLCWSLLATPLCAEVSIPAGMKRAAQVDPAIIKQFVEEQFKKLAGSDPDAQRQARQALVETAAGSDTAFALAYGTSVNEAAVSLLKSDPSVRVKVNVGVVVAGTAEGTHSTRLEPAILALLGEKSQAVNIWGVKAAHFILADLARMNADQALIKRLVEEAKQHPSGPMTDETYQALMTIKSPQVTRPLLELVNFRIGLYAKGMPQDPQYDYKPFYEIENTKDFHFLLRSDWSSLTEAQRVEVMQAVVDLMTVASKRGDDPAAKDQRDQFKTVINRLAGGLIYVFDGVDQNAFNQAKQVAIQTGGSSIPPSLDEVTKGLLKTIREMPAYKTLKPTPPLVALQTIVGP